MITDTPSQTTLNARISHAHQAQTEMIEGRIRYAHIALQRYWLAYG